MLFQSLFDTLVSFRALKHVLRPRPPKNLNLAAKDLPVHFLGETAVNNGVSPSNIVGCVHIVSLKAV